MDITSCIYKGSKSYGVKTDGLTKIFVGTSASNSHHFADVKITHRDLGEGQRSFRLYVDGEVIKEGLVQGSELEIAL
jgi:hypothetical protein